MATKISVYSLSELKSTIDDHIPIYLTSPNLPPTSTPLAKALRLTESHYLTTVRLVLGYAAVAVALYIFYLDYYLKVPWAEHKNITIYAVFTYFILNCLLTVWTWYAERGVVFVGSRGGNGSSKSPRGALDLRLSSHPPKRKYDPVYRLGAEWTATTASGKQQTGQVEAEAPFRLFFQADGTFVSGEFERWLRKTVPVLAGEEDGAAAAAVGGGGAKVIVDSKAPTTAKVGDGVTVVDDAAPATPRQSARESTPVGTAKKRSKKKG